MSERRVGDMSVSGSHDNKPFDRYSRSPSIGGCHGVSKRGGVRTGTGWFKIDVCFV